MSKILPVIYFVFSAGATTASAAGLVPDCGPMGCGLNDLLKLLQNVYKFVLYDIGLPLGILGIAIGGVMMVIYSDNESKRNEAKSIIWWAIAGLAIAFAGWLIINTILKGLGYKLNNPL